MASIPPELRSPPEAPLKPAVVAAFLAAIYGAFGLLYILLSSRLASARFVGLPRCPALRGSRIGFLPTTTMPRCAVKNIQTQIVRS